MNDRLSLIGEVCLEDSHGGRVRLGDLWKSQPIVIVWLRHYG
jgi:hypothetical protein